MTDQDLKSRLQNWIPKLVLSPSLALTFVFVYGFIVFTVYLSFTNSRMLPNSDLVGFANYERLWGLRAWWTAIENVAIFASLYIIICIVIGLSLAIFLDQKIRGEGMLRPI
ncbi:MAG: sugar ABC transporter permease, partial [Loktanella sp.]|nr:sugar ABC transporter permease [Loktanella sp.]